MTRRVRGPLGCDAVQEWLLEAEPAELRGEGDSRFVRHLRECAACREAAQAVQDLQRRLARELGALRSRIDPAGAVALALRDRGTLALPDRGRGTRGLASGWSGWSRRTFVPLAAAAVAAGLWLVSSRSSPPTAPPEVASSALPPRPAFAVAAGETRFSLRIPERRGALVFATRDPAITVVWFYAADNRHQRRAPRRDR